jgi:hypothetical protein
MNMNKKVVIEIRQSFAWIDPPCEDILGPLLTFDEVISQPAALLGFQIQRQKNRFCRLDPQGRLITLAGFVPRIKHVLTATGQIEVQIVTTANHLLVPDQLLIDCTDGDDRDYLDALMQNTRGQIVVQNPRQLEDLLLLTCWLYSGVRILVVAYTREEVKWLYRMLAHSLPDQVAMTVGIEAGPHLGARILVTTGYTFPHALQDTDRFEVVLIIQPHAAVGGPMPVGAYTDFGRRNIYAFIPPELEVDEQSALEVEGICGPIIYEAFGPWGRRANIQVLLLEPPLTPTICPGKALEHKRQCIWHNPVRNQFLTDVAIAMATGQDEIVHTQGPLSLIIDLRPEPMGGRRVIVLVENIEHGQELANLLPDWPLFCSAARDSGSPLPASGLPAKCIVSLFVAHQLPELPFDVLIHATAGKGPPDVPGFPPRFQERRPDVVLIDLADEGDERSEENTHHRLSAYKKRRWQVSASARWLHPPGKEGQPGEDQDVQG